ncbi:Extracellular serine-rich protein [Cladobotryum mycophilum]|uniref:Extracellular serine-rich protein n=1 Tax=Cladobotryum mycophilum TaxID=491253 RepID=A0ABR0S930_9HYPO
MAWVTAAATIRVDAGLKGLSFTPDSITAKVGDVLEFHFHAPNHSVVMSDFGSPCQPSKTGGFFSGFIVTDSSEATDVFQVEVNSTDPIFFYCAQNLGSHCASGMSGVVNPSKDQSLSAYQKSAKSVTSAGSPASVFGGEVVPASKAQATATPSPTSSPGGSSGGGGLYGGGGNGII